MRTLFHTFNRKTSSQRQKGVALITALVIVALVTVITVSAASEQQYDLRRTANVIDSDGAYVFALGAESWAMQILSKDAKDNKTDNLDEDWNTKISSLPVEGAVLSGRIDDMQGRFNLNNLIDKDGKRSDVDVRLFQRLLAHLDINRELVDAIVDWLDTDIDPTMPGGAEDGAYLGLQQPYRAANRIFSSPSELMLVFGVTSEIYNKLEPFVTVLPEHGVPINVNTAAPELLMTLAEGITEADAEELIAARKDTPFADTEEFINQPEFENKKAELATERISVSSKYFMVTAAVQFGNGHARLYSLLQRGGENSGKVDVVMRGQGTY